MMRILITSGGTKVPIDPVRYISNSSTGGFGAAMARCALQAEAETVYLVSSEGKSPFAYTVDLSASPRFEDHCIPLAALNQLHEQYGHHYHEYRYQDFYEYAALLKQLVQKEQPDIVILCAAVSDYLVSNYSNQKIRSSESLTIQLETAPKLIHSIKKWSNNSFVVGFKLLVGATESELVAAALNSIKQNNIDLVAANDLSSIKRGVHEVLLVEPNGTYQKYIENAASQVIARSLKRWE